MLLLVLLSVLVLVLCNIHVSSFIRRVGIISRSRIRSVTRNIIGFCVLVFVPRLSDGLSLSFRNSDIIRINQRLTLMLSMYRRISLSRRTCVCLTDSTYIRTRHVVRVIDLLVLAYVFISSSLLVSVSS